MKIATRGLAKSAARNLPGPVRRWVRTMDSLFASRPVVDRRRGRSLERGAVVLSLDFELAWAWPYAVNPPVDPVATGLREREQVPMLVRTFEEFSIPATWATVGHLFLERCSRGSTGCAHEHLARLPFFENHLWRFSKGDWFQHDPCTDVRRDPAWYGPDLIQLILGSRVRHEIGCHGFSHAGLGPYCPPDVARAEAEECRKVMKDFGVEPVSWVFPGNDEGNHQALWDSGIRIVRSYPRAVHIALPEKRPDGLWEVHSSTGLSRGEGWPMERRLTRLKRFLQRAVETRMAMHLWLHPSLDLDDYRGLLVPFLRACAELREAGRLDVVTMSGLVSAVDTL